jgi:alcohol dehydrogenase
MPDGKYIFISRPIDIWYSNSPSLQEVKHLETPKIKARRLITEFKGDSYSFGNGCLSTLGEMAARLGKKTLLISNLHTRDSDSFDILMEQLAKVGITVIGHTQSSRPNSPTEDVLHIRDMIRLCQPDSLVAVSGGSGIDAAKAANVLACLGGDLEDYFGTDRVRSKLAQNGNELLPLLAVQTASGSAAHLSKYSNVTNLQTQQKKLIVDDSITPPLCLFDYTLTKSMSPDFTCDGAFDGLAHCLEVYFGARPEGLDSLEDIALRGMECIIASLEEAVNNPNDLDAREGLGLGTDLGGYCIMIGGTNGAHLNSFSLVDILSHGRACAILNPYYTVFFAPAIPRQLQKLGAVLAENGLMKSRQLQKEGRELGIAVAVGLINLAMKVGFPATLQEVEGITQGHLEKALAAAKNPQLSMKLRNMPIPLTADLVDDYMGPVLEAAYTGDFSRIKSVTA